MRCAHRNVNGLRSVLKKDVLAPYVDADAVDVMCLSETKIDDSLVPKFKDLLTEVRRELAEKYIRDRSLSLTEITFLLGFSEASSFSRAYRGWTGSAPSAHRESLFSD